MEKVFTESKEDGEVVQVRRDKDEKSFDIRHISDTASVRSLGYLKRWTVIALIKNLARAAHIDILMRSNRGVFVKPEDFHGA